MLPEGVQVTPLVHLLGAIAGLGAFAACNQLKGSDH
jgi:hypothetical protein